MPRARASSSAICSSCRTSGQRTSRASPGRYAPWRRCDRARWKAASRRCTPAASPPWSAAKKKLELLLRRWARAKSGEGQVVLLSGEAGIGKSRLTAALLERLAGEPHTRLRYFCSPQHTDSAFYPIIGQMERAAGLAHDDTPQAKARQARCAAGANRDAHAGRRALCRDAVAAERRTLSRARADPAAAPAKNTGSAHFANGGADAPTSGADDLRGCALDRPHQLGSVRSSRGPDSDPSVLLIVTLPAGIRTALDRTAARDRADHQSVGRARHRRHDRRRRRQQTSAGEASGKTSSSAATAFHCSWKR